MHLANALPCPFCGSARIVKGERFFAMCVDCGATGPERNSDATVRKFTGDWNTRQFTPLGRSSTHDVRQETGSVGTSGVQSLRLTATATEIV